MDIQEAIDSIKHSVAMVQETGGSIKSRLEADGSLQRLNENLNRMHSSIQGCLNLPSRLFQKVKELDEDLKFPHPDEDEIGRDVAELEALLRSAIDDSCK